MDNINAIKTVNNPLIQTIKKLRNANNNILSFVRILVHSKTFIKDSVISTTNIQSENLEFVISKCLRELNNFSMIMEELFNHLNDKINRENNALDEKNPSENPEFYNFSFKIKVSLTLKNHNNEMVNSLRSLIVSLNSFFSIVFQICQVSFFYFFFLFKQFMKSCHLSFDHEKGNSKFFDYNKIKYFQN